MVPRPAAKTCSPLSVVDITCSRKHRADAGDLRGNRPGLRLDRSHHLGPPWRAYGRDRDCPAAGGHSHRRSRADRTASPATCHRGCSREANLAIERAALATTESSPHFALRFGIHLRRFCNRVGAERMAECTTVASCHWGVVRSRGRNGGGHSVDRLPLATALCRSAVSFNNSSAAKPARAASARRGSSRGGLNRLRSRFPDPAVPSSLQHRAVVSEWLAR
jgi:hypothetical protein